jgi:hypothetical protein
MLFLPLFVFLPELVQKAMKADPDTVADAFGKNEHEKTGVPDRVRGGGRAGAGPGPGPGDGAAGDYGYFRKGGMRGGSRTL